MKDTNTITTHKHLQHCKNTDLPTPQIKQTKVPLWRHGNKTRNQINPAPPPASKVKDTDLGDQPRAIHKCRTKSNFDCLGQKTEAE